jgi:anti-sigma factor RsiW
LKQRIADAPELSPKASDRHILPGWLAPGLAGALAASLAMVLFVPVSDQSGIDQQLVSSHVRSLQPGHLTDVQTTNQHIVKPWFNGKIDFAPPVPELASKDFRLPAAGSIPLMEGRLPRSSIIADLHTVNLFVWPSTPASERTSDEDGFELAEWSDGGLRFAAVSDIPPQELQQFERAFRDQVAASQR